MLQEFAKYVAEKINDFQYTVENFHNISNDIYNYLAERPQLFKQLFTSDYAVMQLEITARVFKDNKEIEIHEQQYIAVDLEYKKQWIPLTFLLDIKNKKLDLRLTHRTFWVFSLPFELHSLVDEIVKEFPNLKEHVVGKLLDKSCTDIHKKNCQINEE